MTVETLDRVSEIAKEKLAELEASKSQEAKPAEAGTAAPGSSPETQKTQEEQAKEDESILSAKEEELTEEQRTRKAEIIKEKEAKETPEERIKRIQEVTQKRIDELIGELKAERAQRSQDNERVKALENEIIKLKQPPVSVEETLSKREQDRIARYIQEDVDKPREQRREMSDSELDEFYLEDPRKYQEWLTDRAFRRAEEKQQDKNAVVGKPDDIEFAKKQTESRDKLVSKYPGCNQVERAKALEKEGKKGEEITQILMKENEQFRIMMEIINENPKKYFEVVDGPELVLAEMDKRLSGKGKVYTESEVEARIKQAKEEAAQMERSRIASLDTGLTSTTGRIPSTNTDPIYQKGLAEFLKAAKFAGKNWTEEDYKKRLAERKSHPEYNDR